MLLDPFESRKIGGTKRPFENLPFGSGFLEQGDEWLRNFWGMEAARFRDAQVTSWDDMKPLVKAVVLVALFRLMASWDVEFHAHYLTD